MICLVLVKFEFFQVLVGDRKVRNIKIPFFHFGVESLVCTKLEVVGFYVLLEELGLKPIEESFCNQSMLHRK